jgi:hypothetical protein
MMRHTNHQEIPRLNARARQAVRDGHAYLKRCPHVHMANVQRAYCAQNDVCSDRDESLSLGTQIQYANRFCHRQSVSLVH